MNDDRQAIAKKINALLSKTVANGASEHEAMQAVQMAMKLMDKYQVTMTELEVKEEGFDFVVCRNAGCYNRWFAHGICNAIATLTNTKALFWGKKQIRFYGFKGDIVFAEWVYNSLMNNIMKASVSHVNEEIRKGSDEAAYMLRKAFIFGAVSRISARIWTDVRERKEARKVQSSSRALVIVNRGALVETKMAEMFPKLGKAKAQKCDNLSLSSYKAGQTAGDKASYNRPVGSQPSSSVKQLN